MQQRYLSSAVLLSLIASFLSISFTLIEALYEDHHYKSRKLEDTNDRDLVTAPNIIINKKYISDIDEKHANVLELIAVGYSIDDIKQAWVQMKMNPNYCTVTEDHEQFRSDIVCFLDKIIAGNQLGLSIVEEEKDDGKIDVSTSISANLSTAKLEMGEHQPLDDADIFVSADLNPSTASYYAPKPMYPQSMESLSYGSVPAFQVRPQGVYSNASSISNLQMERNPVTSVDGIALAEIDTGRIFLDFSHPNVSKIYYRGFTEDQILRAYHVLKIRSPDDINVNHPNFENSLLACITKVCNYGPKRQPRIITNYSLFIDLLWQNFICCCCFKFIDDGVCSRKRNKKSIGVMDDTIDENSMLSRTENLIYIGMYFFLITDFVVRIYPFLLFGVIFQSRDHFIALIFMLGILSYASYFYVINDVTGAVRFKSAMKYFWIGWFSCSYWFLSTMHLSYLKSNVSFVRLMSTQKLQLVIQLVLCICIVFLQYIKQIDTWGDFWSLTAIVYPAVWVVNALMIYPLTHFMKSFEKRLLCKKLTVVLLNGADLKELFNLLEMK